LSLPNYLTLFRIILVPVFFTLLLSSNGGHEPERFWALAVFALAALTDALDGFFARLYNARTTLGTFLDPLADKLLLLTGYIGLLFVDSLPYRPPLWITVTIVFRDILIVCGLALIFIVRHTVSVRPHVTGKITTFFQMICLIAILLKWPAAPVLAWTTAFFCLVSAIVYIHRDFAVLLGETA